jgi:hypothetical protein
MKWIGNRISFEDDKLKTTIVIRPEDKPLVKALMGAWVAMWMVIGVTVAWYYFNFDMTKQEKIIVFVFMTFWFYYAFRVFRSFFWIMWGKELIKIDEAALTYKKSIKGYGRAIPYYLENINKMCVQMPEANSIQTAWESTPWIRGGERLEFEYMNQIVRFGRKIEEKEAKLLYNLIKKRIEDQLKKRKV